MLRYLITFLLFYLAFRLIRKYFVSAGQKYRQMDERQKPAVRGGEDLVEDPYCHTYVPKSNAYKTIVSGKTLYFCSKRCFEEFTTDEKKGV